MVDKIKEETKKDWTVANVPANYEPAIINESNQRVLNVLEALAEILNTLEEIKKKI